MILADVNVLIYAFRADTPQHALCHAWLTTQMSNSSHIGFSTLALSALVRITTNHRIFREPSTLEEAFGFCDYLREQPNSQLIEPGPRHWEIFRDISIGTETKGARITDAWFAALAMEHGCEWATMDRDFARFPGLRWKLLSSAA